MNRKQLSADDWWDRVKNIAYGFSYREFDRLLAKWNAKRSSELWWSPDVGGEG